MLPNATDEEWYSPKRPYSTVVNLSFMTIFTTNTYCISSMYFYVYRTPEFCNLCTRVFDRKDTRSMKFDDFIQCCVMINILTDSFKKRDTQRSGVITVHYEDVSPFIYIPTTILLYCK